MPSRKQRRRREKERRHEYEYVYVDDEGHEFEAEADESKPKATKPRNDTVKEAKARGAKRPVRETSPPSWTRSTKRALLFFPLFFIVFSLVNKHQALAPKVAASLAYSLLFIPLTYMMDRMAYRTYLRRSGRDTRPKR